jgi:hypothetical protein
MTAASATRIGTGCPRLSRTRGSPSGDTLRGGAARPAAPRAYRCRPSDGGPRQLRGSTPVPRAVSVAVSAGRARCESRQLVSTITSYLRLGAASAWPDAGQLGPAFTASRTPAPPATRQLRTAPPPAATLRLLTGLDRSNVAKPARSSPTDAPASLPLSNALPCRLPRAVCVGSARAGADC